MASPYPNWYYFSSYEGRVIGSEHPENLHSDPWGKKEISRRIASYLRTEHNVSVVLNLTKAKRSYGLDGIREYHFPFDDNQIAETEIADLDAATGIISKHVQAGEGVWVHCQAGIDRTGCVIGCFLTTLGIDAEQAISQIKENWPDRRKSKAMYHDLWEPSAQLIRDYALVGNAPESGH